MNCMGVLSSENNSNYEAHVINVLYVVLSLSIKNKYGNRLTRGHGIDLYPFEDAYFFFKVLESC